MVFTESSIVVNILLNRLFISSLGIIIFVTSCSKNLPGEAMCRVNQNYPPLSSAPAACLIRSQGKLLAIQQDNNDNWSLPHHKLLKSISAQCGAHRAVWKSTGLNVEVGVLLHIGIDQTHYFACHLTDDYSKQLEEFPIPKWANLKVTQVNLLNPFELSYDQWSETVELIKVREMFNKVD
jgi:hypothetical protein